MNLNYGGSTINIFVFTYQKILTETWHRYNHSWVKNKPKGGRFVTIN